MSTIAAGPCWVLSYKINSDDFGFNFKLFVKDGDDATVRTKTTVIGNYMRYLLPSAAEVFYAAYSKDGPNRDARLVNACCGAGLYLQGIMSPVATYPDYSKTCVKVRGEHTDGNGPTRKLGPLPDAIVTGDAVTGDPVEVTFPVVGAIPVPGAGADWRAECIAFLKYVGTNTDHVLAGRIYGGAFRWVAWTALMLRGLSTKKGGRVSRA